MNHEHNWVDVPVSFKGEVFGMEYQVSVKHCTICNLYDHTISLAGYSYEYFAMTAAPGVEGVIQNLAIKLYCSIFGENATATKFQSGGGSTSGGGVGRPKGYADDNGTANITKDGLIAVSVPRRGIFSVIKHRGYDYVSKGDLGWHDGLYSVTIEPHALYPDDISDVPSYIEYQPNWYIKAPYSGVYYLYDSDLKTHGGQITSIVKDSSNGQVKRVDSIGTISNRLQNRTSNRNNTSFGGTSPYVTNTFSVGDELWVLGYCSVWQPYYSTYTITPSITVYCQPYSTIVNNQTNITINNNTWNGNIYTDNSTNLTYIYPQYTTVNEKNETVTNISNNPIIYNSETKQYYTYDQTTKNYYYITYNAPSPSPTPAPTEKPGGSISTPETGKPGGDTGDTTGILAVLVEIRDNMIQGFLDIKAAFVAGFAELSANFTLAIENLNVNIQNIFNKKFPDQSTPETALPSPTPSPSPAPTDPPSPSPAPTDPPSPSPAPDPGKPDSGDKTNNFWTIIFPHGGGTEDGKKGIFWALVSLILALIAFFANLAVGVGYLFPFLPDGVVMTINTCLIVIFLFTIIKFIMRSK